MFRYNNTLCIIYLLQLVTCMFLSFRPACTPDLTIKTCMPQANGPPLFGVYEALSTLIVMIYLIG